jgi:hypothetical protein
MGPTAPHGRGPSGPRPSSSAGSRAVPEANPPEDPPPAPPGPCDGAGGAFAALIRGCKRLTGAALRGVGRARAPRQRDRHRRPSSAADASSMPPKAWDRDPGTSCPRRALSRGFRAGSARVLPAPQTAGASAWPGSWRARQPEGVRYGRMSALRKVLGAGVRWGYLERNPRASPGATRSLRLGRCASTPAPRSTPSPPSLAPPSRSSPPPRAPTRGVDGPRAPRRRPPRADRRRAPDVSGGDLVDLGETSVSRRQVPLSASDSRRPRGAPAAPRPRPSSPRRPGRRP